MPVVTGTRLTVIYNAPYRHGRPLDDINPLSHVQYFLQFHSAMYAFARKVELRAGVILA